MRTLGVDLAAQDKNTATCAIEWGDGRAVAHPPESPAGNESILGAMREAQAIGIDAPFGWPAAMVAAVSAWASGEPWPANAERDQLRYRRTDWFVQREAAVWPLSVSSDRIAVCAWRCSALLTAYDTDAGRRGDQVFEAYPAAALVRWDLPRKGYKAAEAHDVRDGIIRRIEQALPQIEFADDARDACVVSHDALDAFICSLIARAAARQLTVGPPDDDHREAARQEGWIHLPEPDSLAKLAA